MTDITELRCVCGKELALAHGRIVEIKCRRCKALNCFHVDDTGKIVRVETDTGVK